MTKVIFCAYDGKNIINGINTWLIRLLPQLAQNGVEVSVIFITWAPEADCTTIPLLRAKGIKCIVIPTAHYSEKIIKWILRHLRDEKPDIFIPGNMVPALHASKWVKQAGIATVAILHNDDSEYEGIINGFIAGPQATNLSATVAVSAMLYQKAQAVNGTSTLYRIPYGAPVPTKKSIIQPDSKFKVVYIGRIAKEQKRIDDIVISFCTCAISMPDAEFYIYGSGPDEYIVNNIIDEHQNPGNIFFAGRVNSDEVENVLLDSHVTVLMSDYEGIPVALMEAMACGVVPICKPIGSGIPELVIDGVTGLFINTPTDLLAKLEYLKADADNWKRLSANCRKLIQDSFSSDDNLKKWLSLLQNLNSSQKHEVSIPSKITLPPAHPYFIDLDRREPPFMIKAIKKIKRILNN